MKKVLVLLTAATLCLVAVDSNVFAQALTDTQQQTDEKVAIKIDELPEAVKTALASDSYKGWAAESAVHNKTKNVYEITVKKDAETKVLTFDKDGKAVE